MQFKRTAIRSVETPLVAGEPGVLSGYVAGIPFLLAAVTPCLAFQPAAVLAGFVLAVLAFFTVQLPVAAVLLGSSTSDATEFALSRRVYLALLTAWTLTAWLASAANA